MAVPSILVAVIATGVPAKARRWEACWKEKEERAVVQLGWVRADRHRCRIRPRDCERCLAATPDKAEPLEKVLRSKGFRSHEGRGTEIPFAADRDEEERWTIDRMWRGPSDSELLQRRGSVSIPAAGCEELPLAVRSDSAEWLASGLGTVTE
jgi:hypothetical protein